LVGGLQVRHEEVAEGGLWVHRRQQAHYGVEGLVYEALLGIRIFLLFVLLLLKRCLGFFWFCFGQFWFGLADVIAIWLCAKVVKSLLAIMRGRTDRVIFFEG
jgi:hypothetical protein